VPILVGLLTVAVLAGAAVLVLHLRGSGGSPQTGQSSSPSGRSGSSSQAGSSSSTPTAPTTPRAVVNAYYRDLNQHHYLAAYRLNTSVHNAQSFTVFKSGYNTTEHTYLTITGVSGEVVSVNLKAVHTDGSLYYFSGPLTVSHGKIIASDIVQV
jgi:hypothetical protein